MKMDCMLCIYKTTAGEGLGNTISRRWMIELLLVSDGYFHASGNTQSRNRHGMRSF